MAKYDVHRLDEASLVVSIQSDYLNDIATRLVAPLLPLSTAPKGIPRLNPVFQIDGADYALFPQLITAVPRTILPKPYRSLAQHADKINSALDMLLYGF